MMRTRTALTMAATLGFGAIAAAQNALDSGNGNALDAGLSRYGGQYNQPQATVDFNARNLLVTGNVAGGRGFRGTVGYTAEFDFRGQTGSDDLFVERANSAFSAPTFFNAGRSMEQLRFGQHLNEVAYISATHGATVSNFQFQRFASEGMLDQRLALDRVAISSTTSAIYEAAADSRVIAVMQDPDGNPISATASSLLGVQMMPMRQQAQIIGLTSYDMARTIEDLLAGRDVRRLGDPFDSSFQNMVAAAGTIEPIVGRIDAETHQYLWGEPGYQEIMETIARRITGAEQDEPIESTPQLLESLDEKFEALRAQLAEMYPDQDTATTEQQEPTDGVPARPPGLMPTMPDLPTLEVPEGPVVSMSPDAIDAMAPMLQHGQRVERFANPADEGRFNELMTQAEEFLRDGLYFWSEHRFERALRLTPGHPYATAGAAHSALGAGFFVPAGLSLRQMLTSHPEMIDVKYGPDLLPGRPRIAQTVQKLRELIETVRRDRELHGFLLAYLGHQLSDQAMIAEGLAIMDPSDPLRALLEKVWG